MTTLDGISFFCVSQSVSLVEGPGLAVRIIWDGSCCEVVSFVVTTVFSTGSGTKNIKF